MNLERALKSAWPFVAFSFVAPIVSALWSWRHGTARPATALLYFNLSIWPASWFGVWPYTIIGNIVFFAVVGVGVAFLAQRSAHLVWIAYGILLVALLFPFGWQPLFEHFDVVRQHPTSLVHLEWVMMLAVAIVSLLPFLAVLTSNKPTTRR
jgi:hypothetical protein